MEASIEVPWKHSRCIICLSEDQLSLEHLIPKSLGGNLTCRFVCNSCNSRIGHLFEGKAKADPSIQRLAVKLAEKLPALAKRLTDRQPYVSMGPGGKSAGYLKDGYFVTRSQTLEDGSLIQDTPRAMKSIRSMLKRAGSEEVSIAESLSRFESAPDNTLVPLAHGLEAIKWSIEHVEPSLDGPLLPQLVPLKSAYEFMALHLGSAIYDEVPALRAVRTALSGGKVDQEHLLIERLHAQTSKLIHGIAFEGNAPYAKVQIRLFGQLAFRIHFRTLSIEGSRFVYTHDLESNTEHVANLSEEEKR